METPASNYPLSWPTSWPRTPRHRRTDSPFFSQKSQSSGSGTNLRSWKTRGKRSMADSIDDVHRELRALGVSNAVISTNVETRLDGLPYSNRRAPDDTGAAIYFKLKGRPVVLACDKWNRVEDNLYAIAKHIEALRGQERWGVGSVEQAFAGYAALPPPGGSQAESWWMVLGVAHNANFVQVRDAYLAKCKDAHPDRGGSHDAMVRITAAFAQAEAAFKR